MNASTHIASSDFGNCLVGTTVMVRVDAGISVPRPPVQQWVNKNYGGQGTRAFGEAGPGKYFAHSFELPTGRQISAAFLEVTTTSGHSSDSIAVGVDYPHGESWHVGLDEVGASVGKTSSIRLDLSKLPPGGASLLKAIVAHGHIDLAVFEQATVHAVALTLCMT